MARVKIRLNGTTPLLQHNGRLADPINEHARALAEVTAKRKKTLDDHREIARREFIGGLVQSEDGSPCITAEQLLACLRAGAKKRRLGTAVQAGVIVEDDAKLSFSGPKDMAKRFSDGHFDRRPMRTSSGKTARTRPRFDDWSCVCDLTVMEDIIDVPSVIESFQVAGEQVGIGDSRPQFGRFTIEVIEQ